MKLYGSKSINLFILTAFILVVTAGGVLSTESLSGVISDFSSEKPLDGATIRLGKSDRSMPAIEVMTGADGKYEIPDLNPGAYDLIISYLGFKSEVLNKAVIMDGVENVIDISLMPSAINLDAISVTASRRKEKLLDAPAAVSIVSQDQIREHAALTPTDHIKGLPAVDIANTGLNQSNVVVRGFNNIFSGAMLVMTDNRIARVPSLRFNAYNFISTTNEDIERIEVVSGPGSALYGPNSSNGVMHIMTRSPFSSQGTTVTFGGGEREVALGSFRHAGVVNEKIGYKFSGQYYQGTDWKHEEPTELENPIIQFFRPTSDGPVFEGEPFANKRDFDIEKIAGDGRVDFMINDETSLIFNAGFNRATSIELTGLGAGQAIDWTYSYGQTRLTYKDLFVQAFVNMSDAGDTYLLNTGQLIVDKSKLWVGQIQHSYGLGERQYFTYGFDAVFTRPQTESTINGRNENQDNIDELGGYLQSETILNEQFKLTTAIRYDYSNQLEDNVFSPRAALSFKPNDNHNFRMTYNRAYDTPDNNNLFLDLLSVADLGGIGQSFGLPNGNGFDIRVQGVPESGFHWDLDDNGDPTTFYSPFSVMMGGGADMDTPIGYNDPMFTSGVMWTAGRGAVLSGFAASLAAAGQPQAVIDAMVGAVGSVVPSTVSNVDNTMMLFDPNQKTFLPYTSSLQDISRIEPTITQTFELGYKGVIDNRIALSLDLYYTKKNNFIGPLAVETPSVFLDSEDLLAELTTEIGTAVATADPLTQGTVAQLDTEAMGGNENGTAIDELVGMFTAGAASVPFGTVSPDGAFDKGAILVTYRNFGDIDFFGADFGANLHLNQNWDIGGTFSIVSKNRWDKSEDQPTDIDLNAPKLKASASANYHNQKLGLNAGTRLRWVDSFPMTGPFFGEKVQSYKVVDMNVNYEFMINTRLSLTVQNIFDHKHTEFIGAPEIGRLAIMRVTQSF